MNFLSKDAPLKKSITTMQEVLRDVGCETKFSQEKHPLKFCYSINLTSVEAPDHIYANGKGIEVDASMASGLGEYIERLQTNNFFMDFYLPKRKYYPDEVAFEFNGSYLSKELHSLYDPDGELQVTDLVDFNSDYKDEIVALPFTTQSGEEPVYFPLNILNNLYVSNGLASGNSPQEAQVQALSEILERYVKIKIIKSGYSLPQYPDAIIESFPPLHHDILALRKQGYIITVLDASLGGQYPVTAISLINPHDSSLFVSFGAHPILEVALERTMTELMQGRDAGQLDGFETPTFDMEFVADSFNIESHFIDSNGKIGFGFLRSSQDFDYTSWHYQGLGCEAELGFLTGIIETMKKKIYLREYTYLGFYSCQIIIPEVSEIYPVEDLIYNNRNQGKAIRNMILHLDQYDPEEILTAISSLGEALVVDQYIGVIFKHPFTILELKAHLHLMLGNLDEALAALEFIEQKRATIIVELIRMERDNLKWLEYEEGLFSIFGQENVEKGKRIVQGKEFLIDITFHPDYLNILNMYDKLELKKAAIS